MTSTPLTILSFSQYCRYRTVLKRLENMVDKWLRNAIICAIGGIVMKSKNARIMFCKTTVDVPELDDLEIRCDHLGEDLEIKKHFSTCALVYMCKKVQFTGTRIFKFITYYLLRYICILRSWRTITTSLLPVLCIEPLNDRQHIQKNIYEVNTVDRLCHFEISRHVFGMCILAPSLKGRPRKKKSLTRSDSDSYETSSDTSTPVRKKYVLVSNQRSPFI